MGENETQQHQQQAPELSNASMLASMLPLILNAGNVSRGEYEALKDRFHELDKRVAILEAKQCKCHETK